MSQFYPKTLEIKNHILESSYGKKGAGMLIPLMLQALTVFGCIVRKLDFFLMEMVSMFQMRLEK